MTPTEISEHARRAALAFSETGRPREKTWPMIQYGINLAVAEKDKRISELERDCKIWVDEVNEQITELQSKDREIERLTAEVIAFEFEENTSKHLLTEANSKLSEAEKDANDLGNKLVELSKISAQWRDKLSSAQADCETWRKHALALEESGNRSQAEIERLKGDIIEDTSAQDAEDRREEESQRLRDLHIGRNI